MLVFARCSPSTISRWTTHTNKQILVGEQFLLIEKCGHVVWGSSLRFTLQKSKSYKLIPFFKTLWNTFPQNIAADNNTVLGSMQSHGGDRGECVDTRALLKRPWGLEDGSISHNREKERESENRTVSNDKQP